jgi:hypothetical protein
MAVNCTITLPGQPVNTSPATNRNGRFITQAELVAGNPLIALWFHLGFVTFEEVPDPPFDPHSIFGPAFSDGLQDDNPAIKKWWEGK